MKCCSFEWEEKKNVFVECKQCKRYAALNNQFKVVMVIKGTAGKQKHKTLGAKSWKYIWAQGGRKHYKRMYDSFRKVEERGLNKEVAL